MVPIFRMPSPSATETDQPVTGHIHPFISDDATVQLGIGGMSNAPDEMVAESDLKDFGMHTEFCCGASYSFYQSGKLTNAKRTSIRIKAFLDLHLVRRSCMMGSEIIICSRDFLSTISTTRRSSLSSTI